MALFSQLVVAAAGMAVASAQLEVAREDSYTVGVILGNGNGGFNSARPQAVGLVKNRSQGGGS